ncbi:arsenate reductase [Hyaloscypha sp. PMI_1271]|nr:arsenate reductase [Hyaloscypha sp. PMI_1271]
MSTSPQVAVDEEQPKPWYAAYPTQRNSASWVTKQTLLSWMEKGEIAGKDFILVDLRRTDFEGGTIRGSINLPAQSLYPTIPTLYTLLSKAGIASVIWFCGSSRGRGSRAAGWFSDYIQDQNDTKMKSYALEGGIKGWVTAGEEFIRMMDEYDASAWTSEEK